MCTDVCVRVSDCLCVCAHVRVRVSDYLCVCVHHVRARVSDCAVFAVYTCTVPRVSHWGYLFVIVQSTELMGISAWNCTVH